MASLADVAGVVQVKADGTSQAPKGCIMNGHLGWAWHNVGLYQRDWEGLVGERAGQGHMQGKGNV